MTTELCLYNMLPPPTPTHACYIVSPVLTHARSIATGLCLRTYPTQPCSCSPPPCNYPRAEVKANINAPPDLVYAACSKEVDAILGHDVMKSVAHLVPDLLERSHVLLYQGQFDAECGVASNEAWISKLQW